MQTQKDQTQQLANVRYLSSQQLHAELINKRGSEKELLAEIVVYIYEVDRRKLFLSYDHPNLFSYLVKELGYCNASAQRRIDAARLLGQAPGIAKSIASGELNLTQVSIVAQGLKQAKREAAASGEKFTSTALLQEELLDKVKSQPKEKAQQLVANTLNLEIKASEKMIFQRDESLRLELTFSKDEVALLKEVKDLFSHSSPGASYKEVLVAALRDVKKRRDPTRVVRGEELEPATTKTSVAMLKRSVFRKDKSCRWKFKNGQLCGSTFQLQIDHKKSKWLGGRDEQNNLQLLCSAHNRLKYQQEIGC